MVTVERIVVKRVIKSLLLGKDYRRELISTIDTKFLNYCIDFFKKIVSAKLEQKEITLDFFMEEVKSNEEEMSDWYKKHMLSEELDKKDIAYNAGLNIKTITNLYNTATKKIVLKAAVEHYEDLLQIIDELIQESGDLNIELKITFRDVTVNLNLNETLIVMNALAVKRSAIRGGSYSSIGFQIEKPLMVTLARLLKVPPSYYTEPASYKQPARESDFLFFRNNKVVRCEIKLMGRGNPESFDSALARGATIFIANKISDLGKKELDKNLIYWIELQNNQHILEDLGRILNRLGIPYESFEGDYEKTLDETLEQVLNDLGYQ